MNSRLAPSFVLIFSLFVRAPHADAAFLGGTITTSGAQVYSSAITLTNNTTLISTGAGAITFVSTVDGPYSLTVSTAGATTFGGAVGGSVPLANLTTDAAGTTSLSGGSVLTSGGQFYGNAVVLGANTALSSTAAGISFAGTVNGAYSLTVNTAGTTAFGGAVGGATPLANLATDAASTTALNGGSVITSGAQLYSDPMILGANTTLSSTGAGGITFGGTVNGAYSLMINTAGTTAFSGAVGGAIPLINLTTDAAGTTALNAGIVSTTGSQTYSDIVVLAASTTLSSFGAGGITFGKTVNGAYNLAINTAGTTAFGGSVGGIDALISLATDVAGTTALNGNISTTGMQIYSDNVVLGSSATLSSSGAGGITFGKTVNGAYSLVVNAAGATTFNGTVGATTPLASLTTDAWGTTYLSGGSVTTIGSQAYNDADVLGANTALTSTGAGEIAFASSVNGAYGLTVNTAGTTALGGAVGGVTPLSYMSTDAAGTTRLNGGTLVTVGIQLYNDPVLLGTDASLKSSSGGNITFADTINGSQNLMVDSSGTLAFNGAVGAGTPLVNLAFSGGGSFILNAPSVMTTGSQTYDAPVVLLGVNATVTAAGNITFAGAVNGAYCLTVNAAGTTAFSGPVGSGTPLINLATDAAGTTLLNCGAITTVGTQAFNDPVTMGANCTVTSTGAGNVSFFNTVDGAYTLTVNTAGTTAFNGLVGGSTALESLTTDVPGNTVLSGGSVLTSGMQIYNDPVALGVATALSSMMGDITFVNTVNGPYNLALSTGGTITFSGAVGMASALGNLTSSAAGTIQLNGGPIMTTGAQAFNGPVVLGADTTLSGIALSLMAVAGNTRNLTLVNSAASALNGAVSGLDKLVLSGTALLAINVTLLANAVTVNTGATLGGNGSILAPVTVQVGGTLSPGASIGSLTVGSSLSLGGTALLELNKAGATNDLVRGITLLGCGGTLRVTNLSGTLAAGDSFKLFQAASFSGAFANFMLPQLQDGLAWDYSTVASNGTLRIIQSPRSRITAIKAVAPHTMELTGMGLARQLYYVWGSTNVALPRQQWSLLGMTNASDSGLISFADSLATNRQRFYLLSQ